MNNTDKYDGVIEGPIPEPDPYKVTLILLAILIGIPLLIEAGIFAYSWAHADEVKCNWIWCEFTEKRGSANFSSYAECYENGIRINCSNEWGDVLENLTNE